ncbi:MAG: PAS domain S-box protein [Deltaproteobacteria bacterium]
MERKSIRQVHHRESTVEPKVGACLLTFRDDLLSLFSELSMAYAHAANRNKVAQDLVELARKTLHLDYCTLLLLADDKKTWEVKANSGLPGEELTGKYEFFAGDTLSCRAIQKKRCWAIADFSRFKGISIPAILKRLNVSSGICAPLIICHSVTGIMLGHCKKTRLFSQHEKSLFQWIANHSALILQNGKNILSLKESENKFRTVFEFANDPILVIDPKTFSINSYNRKAALFLGYDKKELTGKSIFALHLASNRDLICQQIKKIVEGNLKPGFGYYTSIRKDGSLMPVEVNSTAITIKRKKYILSIFRDLSPQQRLEDNLQRQARELEEKNIALKVLLKETAMAKEEVEDKIVGNVRRMVLPYLEELQLKVYGKTEKELIKIVKALKLSKPTSAT